MINALNLAVNTVVTVKPVKKHQHEFMQPRGVTGELLGRDDNDTWTLRITSSPVRVITFTTLQVVSVKFRAGSDVTTIKVQP